MSFHLWTGVAKALSFNWWQCMTGCRAHRWLHSDRQLFYLAYARSPSPEPKKNHASRPIHIRLIAVFLVLKVSAMKAEAFDLKVVRLH